MSTAAQSANMGTARPAIVCRVVSGSSEADSWALAVARKTCRHSSSVSHGRVLRVRRDDPSGAGPFPAVVEAPPTPGAPRTIDGRAGWAFVGSDPDDADGSVGASRRRAAEVLGAW